VSALDVVEKVGVLRSTPSRLTRSFSTDELASVVGAEPSDRADGLRSPHAMVALRSDTPVPSVDRGNGPTGASLVPAGTVPLIVGDEVVTGWHYHDLHQLHYAFEGVALIETETVRSLLPPQQAVLIPAGLPHCITLTRVQAVSVFYDSAARFPAGDRVRIFPAAPVIREMILYARRWPLGRPAGDRAADTFFEALADRIADALDDEKALSLPTSQDPLVAGVMAYTHGHLADVTLHQVCAAVGTSERSLRRAFVAATGMSWRKYLLQSRLLKAMALLPDSRYNILDVAIAVGFQSSSAFTRAFASHAAETPTAYRDRIRTSRATTVTEEILRDDDPDAVGPGTFLSRNGSYTALDRLS